MCARTVRFAVVKLRPPLQRLLLVDFVCFILFCFVLFLPWRLPHTRTHATCHMPHATCHMPHATCHMPHATCHMPHATCHMPHATCHMPHATCHMPHATCHMPHATCHMPHATCHMPHATCHMPHATCHMPHATCHMPHATCHMPHAKKKPKGELDVCNFYFELRLVYISQTYCFVREIGTEKMQLAISVPAFLRTQEKRFTLALSTKKLKERMDKKNEYWVRTSFWRFFHRCF